MIDLKFYWTLLLQRLPVMLALLIICATFGAVYAVRAPSTYSSTAQLLIEDPQIIDTDERQNSEDATKTLQVIEQRLLTRANLIDVANKLNVFPDGTDMSPDEKMAAMEAATTIWYSAGRGEATMMSVSFTSRDPRMSAAVVNEYTTLILSANSRTRVGRAEERLSFFRQEVERLQDELDRHNKRILEFKNKNANALPENLDYRQNQQSFLQERAAQLESDLTGLRSQRQEMIRLFEQTGGLGQGAAAQTPEQQQLAELQAELSNTLGIYSESSPKVRNLRNRIAAIEGTLAAQSGSSEDGEGTGNPVLDLNLLQIDGRMAAINDELQRINKEFETLQASVTATAANAITLGTLEREQENIQMRYDLAVANLGQAQTTERIETSARGERIIVVEAGAVPSEPSGPNRMKLAAAGIGLGIALAAAFFALMEFLNRTIRRPAELKSRFQITPLAVIPYIETRHERLRRKSYGMAMILAVLIVIPLILWALHTQYMPLDLLAQKIANRLGLG